MDTLERAAEVDGDCSPDGSCSVVDRGGARMGHPAMVVPGAMEALQAVGAAVAATGLPVRTIDLINLRVSQIAGSWPYPLRSSRADRRDRVGAGG